MMPSLDRLRLRLRLRPLRDEQALDEPELAIGARLLAHAQPLARSEVRKRRVWNALSSGRSSRLGVKLTALHVAFASVLLAAVSSAAVGGYYVQRRPTPLVVDQPAGPSSTKPPARSKPRAAERGAQLRAPAALADPESVASADESELKAAAERAPVRPRTEPGATRKPSPPDADAELLVEAMRARGNGDAKRVSELVDQYRARHPQGVLQEEALILSIESAVTRRAANAPLLAREYLKRFPNGRFARQARRALGADPR